jgi:hypothetical protein
MLIAVLFSTAPLPEALAIRLYRAALGLERSGDGLAKLSGDLALGEVRRLGKHLTLGALVGPAYEAVLETPTGANTVRFILTHRALADEGLDADTPPSLPN